jgi:hypothetical protein
MKKILLTLVLLSLTAALALAQSVDVGGEVRAVLTVDGTGMSLGADRLQVNVNASSEDGSLSISGRLEDGLGSPTTIKYGSASLDLFGGAMNLTVGRLANYDYTERVGDALYWYGYSYYNDFFYLDVYNGALLRVYPVDGMNLGIGISGDGADDSSFATTNDISLLDFFLEYSISGFGSVTLEYFPAAAADWNGSFFSGTLRVNDAVDGLDALVGAAKDAGSDDFRAYLNADYQTGAIRAGAAVGLTFGATLDWGINAIASYDLSDDLYAGLYGKFLNGGSYTAGLEVGWAPVSGLLLTLHPSIADGAWAVPVMVKASF